jgi:hypothetical protein
MHQLPRPVLTPLPKVVIDDAPRGQIMWQHPPGTATANQIKDAIEDLTLAIRLGAAAGFGLGHKVLNQRPFFVTEIGRIRLSGRHTPQDNRSRSGQTNFLDTL